MRQYTGMTSRTSIDRPKHRSRPDLERLDDRCLLSGLPPGSLDPTFGAGTGFVLDPAMHAVQSVTLSNGSILVGSTVSSPTGGSDFQIRRYMNSGSIDKSFGTSGQVVTDFFGKSDQLTQLVVDAAYKRIYAVGEVGIGTPSGSSQVMVGVAAYTMEGRPDLTFGQTGKVVTPILSGYSQLVDHPETAMLDPEGNLMVGGMTNPGNLQHAYTANFMVRYTTLGTLDSTFGNQGKVVGPLMLQNMIAVGSSECWSAMACPSTGGSYSIVTVGVNEGSKVFCHFNDGGKMMDYHPMSGPVGAIAFGSDMTSFVSAATVNNGKTLNDIQLDTYSLTYGKQTGSITIDLANQLHVMQSSEAVNAVAIDGTGRIILAGSVTGYNYGSVVLDKALLMRLLPDGHRDNSFGSVGVVTTDFGIGKDSFTQVVVQPDGKILAAGQTSVQPQLILARYLGVQQMSGGGGSALGTSSAGAAALPALPIDPLVFDSLNLDQVGIKKR
jgi:uncharacterized delta-60 repeat protein